MLVVVFNHVRKMPRAQPKYKCCKTLSRAHWFAKNTDCVALPLVQWDIHFNSFLKPTKIDQVRKNQRRWSIVAPVDCNSRTVLQEFCRRRGAHCPYPCVFQICSLVLIKQSVRSTTPAHFYALDLDPLLSVMWFNEGLLPSCVGASKRPGWIMD